MHDTTDTHYIDSNALYRWIDSLYRYYGCNATQAHVIAESLVDANLRGIDSHGVMRVPIYLSRIEQGLVRVNRKSHSQAFKITAKPSFFKRHNIYKIDANNGIGQLAAHYGVELLTKLLKKRRGMGAVAIYNSTHFGAAGYFARMLANNGYIACVMSNSESCVAPYGGSTAILGTNPIAFAIPWKAFPISIDFSTSIVSFGSIFMHQASATSIPSGWGFDRNGNITNNPNKIVTLRTMSEAKGYGLGLVVDILSGVLSGAGFGTQIGNMYKDFSKCQNVGHFIWALDIQSFMPQAQFLARLSSLVAMLYESKLDTSTDQDRIYLPGERGHITAQERKKHGIPIPRTIWDTLTPIMEKSSIYLEK